jgi:hypothetical protein
VEGKRLTRLRERPERHRLAVELAARAGKMAERLRVLLDQRGRIGLPLLLTSVLGITATDLCGAV